MAKSADTPSTGSRGLGAEPYSSLFFFDNPSLGRALRYTFAEKRLGRAVFMNALLLVVALGVVQDLFTRGGFGLISEKLSFGRAAFLTIAVVETVVVTLLGPLSFAHIFNAERREDCFDQVVASGCSPLRVLLGRFAAVLIFLAVTVGSALPFFVLATVVLKGASFADVAIFYGVLALYGACICSMTMATCVAVEDAAFPIVLSGILTLTVVAGGFSPYAPPAATAWSPFRHILVDLAPVARQVGFGELRAPFLYGQELPTAAFSCVAYLMLGLLALAYTCVGPDLELSEGLDSFASVTLKRGAEASRGRRGLAATLLRTVQLRFFYENLSARLRALGPMLRLGSTVSLFVIGHVLTLGTLWPRVAPRAFSELKDHTTNNYLGFTALSIGLVALASSGSRAAVLARVPVLSLGSLKISRFPALFLLLGVALALPPVLFWLACRRQGVDTNTEDAQKALGLYGIIVLYGIFMFSVGLVTAMLTTNPYSAMGSALGIIFFTNLLPLGWIPLFTSNVVTESSSRILNVSPMFAAWAVVEPDDPLTLTTIRDEQTIQYEHKSSWRPFVYLHAPVSLILLTIGLVLERRDARTRKFLSALALTGVILAVPGTASAQQPPPWHVEVDVGLGGRTGAEGFTPITATIENRSGKDETVTVILRETTSGAPLGRLEPVVVPQGSTKRVRGVAPAEPIVQAASTLGLVALTDEKTTVMEAAFKPDVLRTDRLLVVLDRQGALPFTPFAGGLRTQESATPTVRRPRGAPTANAAMWSASFIQSAESLPVTPLAWTGAGAVIVNDLELEKWEPAQAKALVAWLGRGGDLVICAGGSNRAKLLRGSALGKELDTAFEALPAAAARTNVDVLKDERAAFVALLQPTERDRILERDRAGEPLIAQRRCGAGRLTVVAIDPWSPPYLHEEDTRILLERILSNGPRYQALSDTLFPELSALRVQPAKIGPAFGALLLYALIIGPGLYFILRAKKRGLLLWVAIPACTLVFSALTPLYSLVLARSESAMVAASIIEAASSDTWEHEVADALIFSGGLERHEVTVRGEDTTAAVLLPARGFRGGAPRPGGALGAPFLADSLRFQIDVPLWGARYVNTQRVLRASRPRFGRSRVVHARAGTRIELTNDGPIPLEEAVVIFPDVKRTGMRAFLHDLTGPLVRGADVKVDAKFQNAVAWTQGGPSQKDLAQSLQRRLVTDKLIKKVEDAREPFEAILLAQAPDAPPSVSAQPQVRMRAQATLVIARLPFVFEDHVPTGTCIVRKDVAQVASGSPSSAIVTIELPSGAGAGRPPTTLKLEVTPQNISLDRVQLAWRDADGKWQPIALPKQTDDGDEKRANRRALVVLPLEALEMGRRMITLREIVDPPGAGMPDLDATAEW